MTKRLITIRRNNRGESKDKTEFINIVEKFSSNRNNDKKPKNIKTGAY